MNATRKLCLSSLLVPVLCGALATGDKPAFHPAEGTSLTRTWTSKQDLSLEDMQIAVNGSPQPLPFQMEMDMALEQEYGFTDKFVALGPDAPKELRRSFDKLGANTSFAVKIPNVPDGDKEHSVAAHSELEGKTVAFKWNEAEKKHDLAFHESEGDAALLAGLEEDMDLRGLLPGKEVAEGDTWDIDPKALRSLFVPGGDLKLKPAETGEAGGDAQVVPGMDNMSGGLGDMFGDKLEGEAKAEYKGVREIEGAKYGVIHIAFKVSSAADNTEKVATVLKDRELPAGVDSMSLDHMDIQLALESEGDVLWDLAGGFVHSAETSGKIKLDIDVSMKLGLAGRSVAMDQQMTLSGTTSNKLEVSRN